MRIFLRRRQDKLLQRGYPWVFRDQVERIEGEPKTGDAVSILAPGGEEVLGQGLFHESSIIQVRFITSDPKASVDEVLHERLRRAIASLESLFPDTTHVRLVHGESDGVPGTFIDRYGDVLAFSTICAGIERRRDALLDTVSKVIQPRAIVERNDQWLRGKDELAETRGMLRGELDGPVRIEEVGVKFDVDVLEGPKTGFFLDQRFHRQWMRCCVKGRRVLDAFCADGGFGLHAAAAGAAEVLGVDSSERALARAAHNAEINDLQATIRFECADLKDGMKVWAESGRTFDVIVLDPPAFARSKRHLEKARRAYQLLNLNALKMLPPGGILATSSCSTALDEKEFWNLVRYSARQAGAGLRLLWRGCQPPDHPVLPSMPETHYLKFFVLQKLADEIPRSS